MITSAAEHARRRAIADGVIADGMRMAEFARRVKLSHPAALRWLRTYDPERHKALLDGYDPQSLRPHQALCLLLLFREAKAVRRLKDTARALGLASAASFATCMWRLAPDGIDQAIADRWPDESPPEGPGEALRRKWSAAELSALRRLHREGLTFADIGERLGHPAGSCAAKAIQIRLPHRDRGEIGQRGYYRAEAAA